jgi:hypothetical protein
MFEDDWRPSVVGRNKEDGAEKATSISDREGVTDQDFRSISASNAMDIEGTALMIKKYV